MHFKNRCTIFKETNVNGNSWGLSTGHARKPAKLLCYKLGKLKILTLFDMVSSRRIHWKRWRARIYPTQNVDARVERPNGQLRRST